MSEARAPFSRYRELMERHGFRPSRRFGQNFLLDPTLHRAIADAASIGAGDIVLEVGAGLGFLTRELAGRGATVIAAEIDPRLVAILRVEFAGELASGAIVLVPGDVLGPGGTLAAPVVAALDAARSARPAARCAVVANLPYAISGPFLAALVAVERPLPERLALLVQREFAERVVAPPGDAERGAPSLLAQSFFAVAIERRVGSEVFRPRPNVDSAVLVGVRRDPAAEPIAAADRAAYARFVRELFAQRRKTVRHGFERAAGRPLPGSETALGALRAADLTVADAAHLFAVAAQPDGEPG